MCSVVRLKIKTAGVYQLDEWRLEPLVSVRCSAEIVGFLTRFPTLGKCKDWYKVLNLIRQSSADHFVIAAISFQRTVLNRWIQVSFACLEMTAFTGADLRPQSLAGLSCFFSFDFAWILLQIYWLSICSESSYGLLALGKAYYKSSYWNTSTVGKCAINCRKI